MFICTGICKVLDIWIILFEILFLFTLCVVNQVIDINGENKIVIEYIRYCWHDDPSCNGFCSSSYRADGNGFWSFGKYYNMTPLVLHDIDLPTDQWKIYQNSKSHFHPLDK